MKSEFSEEFIEQALVKLLSRGSRSVKAVAQELNVNYHTAKYWLKRATTVKGGLLPAKERRPQDWSAQEQLVALHETRGLSRGCFASLVHYGSILERRKPTLTLRNAVTYPPRTAARELIATLPQEPPRITRCPQSPVVHAEPSVGAPS